VSSSSVHDQLAVCENAMRFSLRNLRFVCAKERESASRQQPWGVRGDVGLYMCVRAWPLCFAAFRDNSRTAMAVAFLEEVVRATAVGFSASETAAAGKRVGPATPSRLDSAVRAVLAGTLDLGEAGQACRTVVSCLVRAHGVERVFPRLVESAVSDGDGDGDGDGDDASGKKKRLLCAAAFIAHVVHVDARERPARCAAFVASNIPAAVKRMLADWAATADWEKNGSAEHAAASIAVAAVLGTLGLREQRGSVGLLAPHASRISARDRSVVREALAIVEEADRNVLLHDCAPVLACAAQALVAAELCNAEDDDTLGAV
jgi:hypothetical protein